MSKRTKRKLKQAEQTQKNLEEELNKLQKGKDPKEVCEELIKFIEKKGDDTMTDIGKYISSSFNKP